MYPRSWLRRVTFRNSPRNTHVTLVGPKLRNRTLPRGGFMEKRDLGFFERTEFTLFRVTLLILFVLGLLRIVTPEITASLLLGGEHKANTVRIPDAPVRSCRVSITDVDGIDHTAHVDASSLFEAVALGLQQIRHSAWAGEIPEGLTIVTVCTEEPAVEHRVQIGAFKKWLSQPGTTPADKMARQKIRGILNHSQSAR